MATNGVTGFLFLDKSDFFLFIEQLRRIAGARKAQAAIGSKEQ